MLFWIERSLDGSRKTKIDSCCLGGCYSCVAGCSILLALLACLFLLWWLGYCFCFGGLLIVCLFLFARGPQQCEPCFIVRCHTTLSPGQFPEVFGTHTLTHTHSHLPPGDCHSLPLCPGILYLCTCRLAAWKPGPAGHVAVAMSVEVHFSFLSSSFLSFFCSV